MSSAPLADSAIACATGGFKGVFLHGVLSAFEQAGLRASAYAAASSAVVPTAAAAVGQAQAVGLKHWQAGRDLIEKPGVGMSEMVMTGIAAVEPVVVEFLFAPDAPRFVVAANAVDAAGAGETQGQAARRRGRLLLLAAGRTVGRGRQWVDDHLTLHLFDSQAAEANSAPLPPHVGARLPLTAANFAAVAYASSRMLHAWDVPAWVDGQAYIDAFYTCHCPAVELATLGYRRVIALATEPVLYRDIFRDEVVPAAWQGTPIEVIAPEQDPAEMGVDYTRASAAGLATVYDHGREQGRRYLAAHGHHAG